MYLLEKKCQQRGLNTQNPLDTPLGDAIRQYI